MNKGNISRLLILVLASIFSVSIAKAFIYGKDYNDVFDFMGMRGFGWLVGFGFIALVAALLLFVFWVWMLIDCLKRDFKKDAEKIAWVLVIIFLHVLGAIIYYFVVKASEKKVRK